MYFTKSTCLNLFQHGWFVSFEMIWLKAKHARAPCAQFKKSFFHFSFNVKKTCNSIYDDTIVKCVSLSPKWKVSLYCDMWMWLNIKDFWNQILIIYVLKCFWVKLRFLSWAYKVKVWWSEKENFFMFYFELWVEQQFGDLSMKSLHYFWSGNTRHSFLANFDLLRKVFL